MLTLNHWKKMPPDHYTDFKGRRMQVKDVVAFLEDEMKRVDALLKRAQKDKEITDIK